jgi:hypothetical protein
VLFVFFIAVDLKEWVDDELKGAEALAYRLDLDPSVKVVVKRYFDMFLNG